MKVSVAIIASFAVQSLLLARVPVVFCEETLAAQEDRVHSLPGLNHLDFHLYAGNVSIDADSGRHLFYALAESASRRPDRDPLVLWLNGGPGCSSLGGGFLSELGPVYPTPNGRTLIRNHFSWNHVANMLFLESPAFVGWSWSAREEDKRVGDSRTAQDSLKFVLQFLKRFPKYRDRPLWLAGESYAGHYIPQLALEILQHNQQLGMVRSNSVKDAEGRINLKGFLVDLQWCLSKWGPGSPSLNSATLCLGSGNPWTRPEYENAAAVTYWWTHGIISTESRKGIEDNCNPLTLPATDSEGALQFWYTHGIISEASYHGVLKHCNFETIYPLAVRVIPMNLLKVSSHGVEDLVAGVNRRSILSILPTFGSLHLGRLEAWDKKDQDKCQKYIDQAMEEFGGINIYDVYADVCLDKPKGTKSNSVSLHQRYDPCIDNEVELYFNRPDVQDALHANQSGKIPGPWKTCNEGLEYSRDDILSSVIPVYEKLLDSGSLDMLIYSGDIDAIVPVIGTRNWIRSLKLKVEDAWRPWRSSTGQVAGWTVGHEKGLRFASVRGAGHMVRCCGIDGLLQIWVKYIPID